MKMAKHVLSILISGLCLLLATTKSFAQPTVYLAVNTANCVTCTQGTSTGLNAVPSSVFLRIVFPKRDVFLHQEFLKDDLHFERKGNYSVLLNDGVFKRLYTDPTNTFWLVDPRLGADSIVGHWAAPEFMTIAVDIPAQLQAHYRRLGHTIPPVEAPEERTKQP